MEYRTKVSKNHGSMKKPCGNYYFKNYLKDDFFKDLNGSTTINE